MRLGIRIDTTIQQSMADIGSVERRKYFIYSNKSIIISFHHILS
jgi:hypothetical protein